MWTLLLALALAADVPHAGAPPTPPADGGAWSDELLPLDVSRPSANPLSLALFEARASLAPPSWRDPLDEPRTLPIRAAADDPLDLEWLIAPKPDPFARRPRTATPIDPYDFSAPAPWVEMRTSTWTDPWRQRELTESLWELREKNGVNLRIGVGRSDCWWR